jgi:hypothetical protein
MNLAPIVLFVYARPWHTEQTLKALEQNTLAKDSILYIYADGAKENATEEQLEKIQQVRQLIRQKWNFKEIHIIERAKNYGLADNIIDGVTEIVNKYGKIIVLEDDIVTSVGFLKYMNDALNLYQHEEKVMHISGYMFPIGLSKRNIQKNKSQTFFYNQASCWGWGTWAEAWKKFNGDCSFLMKELERHNKINYFNIDGSYPFLDHLKLNIEGKVKMWSIKWHASIILNNGFCLHPIQSLTKNIGFDGSREHCGKSNIYSNNEIASEICVSWQEIKENSFFRKKMRQLYLKQQKTNLTNKVKKFFFNLLRKIVPEKIKHFYRLKKYPTIKKITKNNRKFKY